MNAGLVTGCALGGLVLGAALDRYAVTVSPVAPRPKEDEEGNAIEVPTPEAPPATTAGRVAAAVVAGALCAGAAVHFGAVPLLAAYGVFFLGLVAMSVVDLRVGLVPKVLLYPTLSLVAVALAASAGVDHGWNLFGKAALGGAIAFAVFFAIWWLYPRGLGFGDVRLAGLIGAALGWLGWIHLYLGFLVAFVGGALFGVAAAARAGTGRKTRFAFGPALALGAVVSVLWGSRIITAWLGHGS